MKRLLSREQGKTEIFHHDNDGKVTIERVTDVSGILKANQYQRDHDDGYKSEVFNHKARIPKEAIENWLKARGIPAQEFLSNPAVLKRFLNDPDNKVWLTRKGKV